VDIQELQKEAHRIAVEHGFWAVGDEVANYRCFALRIALVHSELSEALEAARATDVSLDAVRNDYTFAGRLRSTALANVAEELADAVIRIADLAEAFRIDLQSAVETKMAHNEGRPWLHGKRF